MVKSALTLLFTVVLYTSAHAGNGRPAGCPTRLWCGCYMAHEMGYTGDKARALWVALNWRAVGPAVAKAAAAAGDIVVWTRRKGGHVGRIVRITRPGYAVVRSGNDSGAVRTRERRISNAIAIRRVGTPLFAFAGGTNTW